MRRSRSNPRGAKVNLIALVDTAWMMASSDAADEDGLSRWHGAHTIRRHVVLAITAFMRTASPGETRPHRLRRKYWSIIAMGMHGEVGAELFLYCIKRRRFQRLPLLVTTVSNSICHRHSGMLGGPLVAVAPNSFISSHHCVTGRTIAGAQLARTDTSFYMWLAGRRTGAADTEWWSLLDVFQFRMRASATYIPMMHDNPQPRCCLRPVAHLQQFVSSAVAQLILNIVLLSPPRKKRRLYGMEMSCLSLRLFVRLSVAWNAYLSGTGLPGPAAATALLPQPDHRCPICFTPSPVKSFTPSREIYASGGGLHVAPINVPHLVD